MTERTACPATENACQNTDREIYRERPGDFYADSIRVTEGGGIGINCGGMVYVKPLREWHRLALSAEERGRDVPICDSHTQAWFTERNHLSGDHGCVVCAFTPSETERSEGWIDIKQRRPESLRDVLVCTTRSHVHVESAHSVRGLWAEAQANSEECVYTHWQELPEAPE